MDTSLPTSDKNGWPTIAYTPRVNGARFPNKVKSVIMSLDLSLSQLARISLAEFVSKLIFI